MFLPIKLLSLFFLTFSTIMGLFSKGILGMWFFLELGTISFLFNLMFISHKNMFKETMKIFLIQSLSGMSILFLFLTIETSPSFLVSFFMWIVMLFKMGAIPFHMWFLNLSNRMSWESMFMFLTIMKFIPLMMLGNMISKASVYFSVLAFIVASISSMFYASMKNLMVLSSLYFLGMLLFSLNISDFWLEMMMIYTAMFVPLLIMLSNKNNNLSTMNWLGGASNFLFFLFIVSLAGLPPFPGFFLKYVWLVEMKIDFMSLSIFFLTSGFMMYLYISFSLKNLLELSNQLLTGTSQLKMNFILLSLFMAPALISLYYCN